MALPGGKHKKNRTVWNYSLTQPTDRGLTENENIAVQEDDTYRNNNDKKNAYLRNRNQQLSNIEIIRKELPYFIVKFGYVVKYCLASD